MKHNKILFSGHLINKDTHRPVRLEDDIENQNDFLTFVSHETSSSDIQSQQTKQGVIGRDFHSRSVCVSPDKTADTPLWYQTGLQRFQRRYGENWRYVR